MNILRPWRIRLDRAQEEAKDRRSRQLLAQEITRFRQAAASHQARQRPAEPLARPLPTPEATPAPFAEPEEGRPDLGRLMRAFRPASVPATTLQEEAFRGVPAPAVQERMGGEALRSFGEAAGRMPETERAKLPLIASALQRTRTQPEQFVQDVAQERERAGMGAALSAPNPRLQAMLEALGAAGKPLPPVQPAQALGVPEERRVPMTLLTAGEAQKVSEPLREGTDPLALEQRYIARRTQPVIKRGLMAAGIPEAPASIVATMGSQMLLPSSLVPFVGKGPVALRVVRALTIGAALSGAQEEAFIQEFERRDPELWETLLAMAGGGAAAAGGEMLPELLRGLRRGAGAARRAGTITEAVPEGGVRPTTGAVEGVVPPRVAPEPPTAAPAPAVARETTGFAEAAPEPRPPQMGERPPPQFGTTQRQFMGEQGGMQGRMFTPEETGQVGQIGLEDVVTPAQRGPFDDHLQELRVLRDEMDAALADPATARIKGRRAEARALRDQYDHEIFALEQAQQSGKTADELIADLADESVRGAELQATNEAISTGGPYRAPGPYGSKEYEDWRAYGGAGWRSGGRVKPKPTGVAAADLRVQDEANRDLASRLGKSPEEWSAAEAEAAGMGGGAPLRVDPVPDPETLGRPLTDAEEELRRLGLPLISGGNPIQRLTELIKAAKPVRGQTEALYKQELRRRAGAVAGVIEGATGREGLPKALGQMKGKLPRAAFEAPESLLKPEEIDDLFSTIWRSDVRPFQKVNTAEALDKLLTGQIPTRGEIKLLEDQFGKELAQAILSKRSLGTRAWENFMDAVNLPRAFMSAWDASAPLRQGIVLTIGHPKESLPAMATMFKAMAQDKFARHVDDAIRAGPNFEVMDDAGLYLAPWDSAAATLTSREETFMSALADRIPGIRQSQRGFVTYLNKLRADVADTVLKGWEGTGKTSDDYKSLARFLNHATGRGDLGPMREMGPIINAVFFSPRLLMSRVQLPLDLFTSTPAVRKLVARDLLAFVGTGTTILSLLKLSGAAEVEVDPRSTDFGKIRMGKQRIDFWGGFQPIARYTAQLLTGQRKTRAGDIMSTDRGEVVARFLRSKLAPVPGLAETFRSGKTFAGQDVPLTAGGIKGQAFNTLVPLFVQDLIESAQQEGMIGLARALPGGLGANVLAYETEEEKFRELYVKKYGEELPEGMSPRQADPELAAQAGYPEQSEFQEERGEVTAGEEEKLSDLARIVLRGDPQAMQQFSDELGEFFRYRSGATETLVRQYGLPEREASLVQDYYNLDPRDRRDPDTGQPDYDYFQGQQERILRDLRHSGAAQAAKALDEGTAVTFADEDLQRVYDAQRELKDGLDPYYDTKSEDREAYRQRHAAMDAKLYLLGQVSRVTTAAAQREVRKLSRRLLGTAIEASMGEATSERGGGRRGGGRR